MLVDRRSVPAPSPLRSWSPVVGRARGDVVPDRATSSDGSRGRPRRSCPSRRPPRPGTGSASRSAPAPATGPTRSPRRRASTTRAHRSGRRPPSSPGRPPPAEVRPPTVAPRTARARNRRSNRRPNRVRWSRGSTTSSSTSRSPIRWSSGSTRRRRCRPSAWTPSARLREDRNTTRTDLPPDEAGADYLVLSSRGRSAGPTCAIDVVPHRRAPVLAPVTGTVSTCGSTRCTGPTRTFASRSSPTRDRTCASS